MKKKGIEKVDSFLLKKYIIPLEHKDFVFYCFKKILYNYKADSSVLQSDTHSELMSLRALSNFKPYNRATKDFSDSVELAGELHGYATPLNALLKLKIENKGNADIDFLNQFIFFCYASFDQLDSVRQLLYEQRTFKGNNLKNQRHDTVIVNGQLAIPEILKEASRQKVIMINESHYDWRHRYFVTLFA